MPPCASWVVVFPGRYAPRSVRRPSSLVATVDNVEDAMTEPTPVTEDGDVIGLPPTPPASEPEPEPDPTPPAPPAGLPPPPPLPDDEDEG